MTTVSRKASPTRRWPRAAAAGHAGGRTLGLLGASLVLIAAVGCGSGAPAPEDRVALTRPADVSPLFQPLPETAEHPPDNPGTPERIDLGHKLFFEPKLSRSGIISCNTCHVVGAAGVDARPVAIGEGAREGPRNSPTVYNAAFLAAQFWDGRAPTLEEQAKGPIQAHVEMDLTPEEAVERLREVGYEPLFRAAFPDEEDPLTFDNIAKAIAAFERTLITPGSAFDRYLGGDTAALTAQQKRGLQIFQEAGCIGCHNGVLLGGNGYAAFSHVAGSEDVGRAAVTGREEDRYVFRIAPLRNVALTAPYFHDGSAATLHDAVAIMGWVQLKRRFNDEEVDALVAFLESLTGEFPLIPHPQLPRAMPTRNNAASGE
ncbi:MAG TPA: cytochrome-c peroxidase [Longimicrobiales bacterium]|nr:cytochrome-c peroxidase [Longimicrobiales bacterium]